MVYGIDSIHIVDYVC